MPTQEPSKWYSSASNCGGHEDCDDDVQKSRQSQPVFPLFPISPNGAGSHKVNSNGESGKAKLNLRARLADLREQVRVENLALHSGTQDDHKFLKVNVGGWALSPGQIKFLQSSPYEYNASAGGLLERICLQRFWIWLATLIPLHLAPCVITAIGFLINLLTCSIMIYYSPDAKQEVPSWALALCGLGVFLYQTCDALDGKQCYKVQNTQIEEFYDHACDSVSTILLVYAVGIAVQCGQWPPLFLAVIFASLVAFYSTHWLSYITNQMVFGKIDVTEGQWVMITIHLVSALFGQSVWRHSVIVSGYPITVAQVLTFMTLATFTSAILGNAAVILLKVKTPLEQAGVRIPRKQCNRIKPLLPVAILLSLLAIVYYFGYYHHSSFMFIILFGVTLAKLTMKLVIAHCTQFEMEITDPSLLAPIMLVLNHFFFRTLLFSIDQALLCALICNTIELARYFTCVSWDLRLALDIDIFAIRYPPGHPKSRRDCIGYYINGLNNQELLAKATTSQTIHT